MRRHLFLALLQQQLFIALLPVLLIGATTLLTLYPSLSSQLQNDRETLAISVSDQVAAHLRASEEQLKLIAMDIVNNPNAAQLSNRLDGFVQVSDVFETVYVTGIDGKIDHIGLPVEKVGTRRLFMDMDVSFTTLWEGELIAGQSAWSNVFVSPITGRQSIALKTRLGLANLIAEIDILEMPTLAQSLSRGNLLVMLLDESATLIAHPDAEISQQQFNMGFSSLFTENVDTVRTDVFQWDAIEYQATVVPLASTRWQVVIAQEKASYDRSLYYLVAILLGIAALTLLITAVIAYRSAIRQTRPFNQLTEMTEKISGGNYDIAAINSDILELQSVSDALVAMANQVKSREQELKELNVELEGRVEARTGELLTINDELTQSVLRLETTMEQLVQSEKLASLGSLVAGIAHELNTPIGNGKIAVSSQQDYIRDIRKVLNKDQLTRTMLNQFIEDIASTAEMAFSNMERASELIRSFKQVAVDQTSSHQREFNLATVVNEVLVTLRPTLKKSPVHVETHIPANIEMHSMPGPLAQILTNLINNSVFHALGDQEELTITLTAELRQNIVSLKIEDTGIGMEEEIVRHAFDPFFTTKMGQGGSGLGLNIVHRMVKGILKGDIHLTSTPGEGTVFELNLPQDITQTASHRRQEANAS